MSSTAPAYKMNGTEPAYPPLEMPDTVERTQVTIWSNGIPLDGDLYKPKIIADDAKLPAVVMCHGWGGSKASAERYAAKLAAEGMIALCFTHTGWGNSGSRIQVVGDQPMPDESTEANVKVRVFRQLIDPLEWVQNYRAAVDYIVGEPQVDTDRIGAWGTSFGGGIAMYCAAHDPRIKVLSVQVASLLQLKGPMRQYAEQRATAIARGEFASVPVGVDQMPNLAGTPHLHKALQYDVIKAVDSLTIPTLMIDASNEALFDIRESCGLAHTKLQSRDVPVQYEIFEGIDHYGIYFEGFDRGSTLARDWFVKHL